MSDRPLQFCFSGTFSQPEELVALARAGDAHGWSTMSVSDHLINPVETRSTYPYTADGSRRWDRGTPWPDPWVTIGHLSAVTERLRFLTTVYILPARTPVHVAKQVGTAAVLSGNRVDLGIGMGWMEEEFDAMGTPFAGRGKRADEMLEVMRQLWTGDVVEHHGQHFDVPPMEMLPAPSEPVPVVVGGTSDAALRRAARNDGWVSDLHTIEELAAIRQRIEGFRQEYDRAHLPFAMYGSARDAWDLDGYRRVHEAGVTHLITMPWYFYAGADADLAGKVEGIERFAEDIIAQVVSGRFLFVTWDGGGNVPPVLALAERLQARGHSVRAVGSDTLATRFADAGVDYVARDPLHEWDQGALAADVAREAVTADVVVSDYMLPGALCGAESAGRPKVALVHTLYAANLEPAGGLAPMHVAATEDGLATVRAGLGLPAVDGFGGLLDRADMVMVTCPEELDAPGERPANVRYVGPVLEGPGPDRGWRPAGVDDGRPIVVVGLGTTAMDEVPVLRRLLSALAEAPARLLVTVGAHVDVDGLDGPDNAQVVGHVRHAALLPWASAVVCHGGLGTVLAALAHGLPVVSVPLGREQPHNAAAVERAGAGLTLSPTAAPAEIRAAVQRAVSDLELRAAAARLALSIDELAQSNSAVQALERHV